MALEIAAGTASFGMRGDDVARVQQALQVLGRDIPRSELEERVLGPGTSAVVRAFHQGLDLTPTGAVEAATVRAINVLRENPATDARMARGSVRNANGNPLSNGFVQAYRQGLGGEQVVGMRVLAEESY
jgi:peptidoglycan hydrolase-like protein with peptidoglycan-binding domain